MKDFISKITFGFLMAQLLPGAIVVFAITCVTKVDSDTTSLKELLENVGQDWFGTTLSTILFIFVAVSIGMMIHGLNWTVLAWLENKGDPQSLKSARETWLHKRWFWLQLLLSPFFMVYEILNLLFRAPNIDCLTMDENISNIKEDSMESFLFLQEFYLNFGQFYAHVAYAFLITTICTLIHYINNRTCTIFMMLIFIYFLTSLFFLLGRIQLGSLFKAEIELAEKKNEG